MNDDEIESEERAIYAIIAAAIAPVPIGVVLEGAALDGGAALGLAIAAFAIAGLVAGLRARVRSRLPVARLRKMPRQLE